MSNSSIWPIDRTLSVATNPGQQSDTNVMGNPLGTAGVVNNVLDDA